MRSILRKTLLGVLVAVFGLALTGCNPKDSLGVPFGVRLVSAGTNSLGLEVVTDGISVSEVAYIISEDSDLQFIMPELLFSDADSIVNVSSNKRFSIDSIEVYVMGEPTMKALEADVDYYIYCAAKTNSTTFYSEIYQLKATTKDYTQYTEMLTVVDTYHDGYKLRITVPESVKNAPDKYAVRYTFTCLPMYMINKLNKGALDYDLLTTNAGMHTNRSLTLDFNVENEVLYDENGDPELDEDGEMIWVHDPIVPGEPTIFLAAQFQWVDKDDPLCPYGWESGYHLHMFDLERYQAEKATVTPSQTEGMEWTNDEDTFWKGDFQRKFFVVDAPTEIDKDFDELIEFTDENITPIKFEVNAIPSDDVEFYCYALIDHATYNAVLPWLDNNEEYMQWFVTSWLATYELGAKTASGPVKITTDDLYYEGLEADTPYHLLVVAIGDDEGKTQKYYDYEFTTQQKTKPAPVIEVTPIEPDISKLYVDKEYHNEHAFFAHFNIKAPNKDVVAASYAANYVKDWVMKMNGEQSTYADVLSSGMALSSEDVEDINSDEGLDIKIPTVDGQTTRLVVSGKNDENTYNNLRVKYPKDSPSIADYEAPMALREPVLNTDLFKELKGKWTAKATLCYSAYVYDENNKQTLTKTLYEWKTNVEITDALVEGVDYPSDLPDSVYAIYKSSMGESYSEAHVDQLYKDFKEQAEKYNDDRLKYQNRLLVKGIVDYDSYDRLEWIDPYSLFCHKKYSSYDNAQIFYDFGPKWYLDIAEGDQVTVPFSYSSMPPVVSWQDMPYYLCGMWYDKDNVSNSTAAVVESEANVGFPVEISDDKNTITVKPIPNPDDPDKPLYMNVVAISNGQPSVYAPLMSELVLTRGWTDKETTEEDVQGSIKMNVSAVDSKGMPVAPKKRVAYKSMTEIVVREPLPVQKIEVITLDSMRSKLEKCADRLTERR